MLSVKSRRKTLSPGDVTERWIASGDGLFPRAEFVNHPPRLPGDRESFREKQRADPAGIQVRHFQSGADDDAEIEPGGFSLDVELIVAEFEADIVERLVSTGADLSQSRHAGEDCESIEIVGDFREETFDNFRTFGARSDERHFSVEDIEDLRQFIEMGSAEESSQGSDPGIVSRRPDGSCSRFAVPGHGANLMDAKISSAETGPVL